MKRWLVWLVVALTLAACGDPSEGPALGAFPSITKLETDAPFVLAVPSSRSPAPFTFTSSNPAVAVLDGPGVIIKGPGETTITASQPAIGSFGPTHASMTLTVTAVPCAGDAVRVAGVCVAKPTCVPPATISSTNVCVAPVSDAGASPITSRSPYWASVTRTDTWTNAKAFCTGTTIGGQKDWRLPTAIELGELFSSGAIAGHNWALGNTWSSDMGNISPLASHVVVDLATGESSERTDTLGAYVACVR